ncbi:MAG: AsmA-like C-terminal region-containing protein [Flavicella sp.]
MQKTLKLIGIILVLFLGLLITIPILFKKQISNSIEVEINKNVNAKIDFESVAISLFENFPNLSVNVDNFSIVNKVPFENDTLLFAGKIHLTSSVSDLISGKYHIKSIDIDDVQTTIKINREGISNYDILNKTPTNESEETENVQNNSSNFYFEIEKYKLNNFNLKYTDYLGNIDAQIINLNHGGNAVLNNSDVLLDTRTDIKEISLSYDGIRYLNKVSFDWLATLNMNLDTQKIVLQENHANLNDIKLFFEGFVQPIKDGFDIDLNFDVEQSKFKSLLSLIPGAYASNFDAVEAKGSLDFRGNIKGIYSENQIPTFGFYVHTEDAYFKYPDLPKAIDHITIDTKIQNKTGQIDDTQIAVNNFEFQIDKDIFKASTNISKPTTNPAVNAKFEGKVNLENLKDAYPIPLDYELKGVLDVFLEMAFTQKDIEKHNYKGMYSKGSATLQQFHLETEIFPHPIEIETAQMDFSTESVTVKTLDLKTHKSDLSMTGTLSNFLEFVFANEDLKGKFDMRSNSFVTSDFLSSSSDTLTNEKTEIKSDTMALEQLRIPAKIDITTHVNAASVSYDNLELKNLTGALKIKNQTAIFEKTKASIFDGNINMEGTVNTAVTPSIFDMNMNFENIKIANAFNSLELFSTIAPFANAVSGTMSSSFKMKGNLDKDLFPDTDNINGKAVADLEVTEIDTDKSETLAKLDSNVAFIDLSKVNMDKIKAFLTIENSKVIFKPFKVATYENIPIELGGSHSFENIMNYSLNAEVPATYLGKNAEKLMLGMSESEKEKIIIPLTIKIDGGMDNPSVKPDFKTAVSKLSSQVVASQKDKVINSILDKVTGKKKKGENSTPKKKLEKEAKKLFKKLF